MQSFVGREHELGRLDERLAEAAAGHPQTVVVEGPAGIGKSALLASVRVPGGPGTAAHRVGRRGRDVPRRSALLQQLTGLADPHLGRPVRGRGRPAAAARRPVRHRSDVFVVDDAHLADTASLRALTFALRRLRADRVLALVATPEDDVGRLPNGTAAAGGRRRQPAAADRAGRPGGGGPAPRVTATAAPAHGRAAARAHRRQPAAPRRAARRGTGGGARDDARRFRRRRRSRVPCWASSPAQPGRAGAGPGRRGHGRRLAAPAGRGGGRPRPTPTRPSGPPRSSAGRAWRAAGDAADGWRCGSPTRWCGPPCTDDLGPATRERPAPPRRRAADGRRRRCCTGSPPPPAPTRARPTRSPRRARELRAPATRTGPPS